MTSNLRGFGKRAGSADHGGLRVLFVGDSHANPGFWSSCVVRTVEANNVDVVAQVGDFGWWPHADVFIRAARRTPVRTLFIDGNHEHFRQLRTFVAHTEPNDDGTVPMGGNLEFVPRGTCLRFGGSRVLFCGGAHSIDKRLRRPDMSWWEDEDVTDADVDACAAHGRVDVVVCHDAPNRWQVPGISDTGTMPGKWRVELAACSAGRDQISRVFDTAQPRLFVHGHYHRSYRRSIATAWGELAVVGLDCDDNPDGACSVVIFDETEPAWNELPIVRGGDRES